MELFAASFVLGLVVGIVVCRWWYHRKLAKVREAREELQAAAELLNGARKALK